MSRFVSKNMFFKTLVFSSLFALPFLYNNCAEQNFVLPETTDLSGFDKNDNGDDEENQEIDLSKPSCIGKADGERVTESVGREQSKEIACPFGGKRIVTESVKKEYICSGEVPVNSGDEVTSQIGEVDVGCKTKPGPDPTPTPTPAPTPAPVVPKPCGGNVVSGTKTFKIEGEVHDTVSCGRGVYSTATFTKQNPPAKTYINKYQKRVEYLCNNGVLQKTGVVNKGNFLGGAGRCAALNECIPGGFTYKERSGFFEQVITRYSHKFGQQGDVIDIVVGTGFITTHEKFRCTEGAVWKKCTVLFGSLQCNGF